MQELDDLLDYCFNQYTSKLCVNCGNNKFCTSQSCSYGDCSACVRHITNAANPRFHYPCSRSTYYYVMHFFYRFASEMKRYFLTHPIYGRKVRFVSLGCGPSSELYGIVDGFRQQLGSKFCIKYEGYDLSRTWDDIQDQNVKLFSTSKNVKVSYSHQNMFAACYSSGNNKIDVLILNYLLSDVIKFSRKGLVNFLNDIANFIFSNKIKIIILNDISYYGYPNQLDSAIKCMRYIIKKISYSSNNIYTDAYCYPSDKYIPQGWKKWSDASSLFNINNKIVSTAGSWKTCNSKYVITHIFY